MFSSCKIQFSISRKNVVLLIEKFLSLLLPRNAKVLKHLINFRFIICQVAAFERLKTNDNLKIEEQPGLNILNQLKHSLAENVG